MVTCFVLIKVEAKKEDYVYKTLLKLGDVEGIREVFGEYDIIARVEAKDMRFLREILIDKIRNIDGVTNTTTLVTLE